MRQCNVLFFTMNILNFHLKNVVSWNVRSPRMYGERLGKILVWVLCVVKDKCMCVI